MNLNLKAVYVCVSYGTWGKGYTQEEAKKNAKVKRGKDHYIQAALFNNPPEDTFKNLFSCITVNQSSGNPQFYQDDRLELDTKQINEYFVGWLTVVEP